MTTLTAVVGNPRQGSRTHRLTEAFLAKLGDAVGAKTTLVDLPALGAALLDPSQPQVAQAREQVAGSDLIVLATPVYKATYTGLLKLFLDGYGTDGLAGTTAVGLIVSAAPHHLLATDIHLRSLLVELGASVPTRSVTVLESQLEDAGPVLDRWLDANVATLRRLTTTEGALA